MVILYVLKLEDGYWYVGTTDNLANRIKLHKEKKACKWTTKHAMIEVTEASPCTSDLLEDFRTKELMQLYGIDKVRGGTYCRVKLNKSDLKVLTKELRMANGQCLKCGNAGHFIAECPTLKKGDSQLPGMIPGIMKGEDLSSWQGSRRYFVP
jgi:hypothetical protein